MREFAATRTILFDGESALKGKKAQKIILEQTNIIIKAEPFFKRVLAEQSIKNIKMKMNFHLNFIGEPSVTLPLFFYQPKFVKCT